MLQAVMTQPGAIEIREVAAPQAEPGEVLINVKRVGVCGSDIHVYLGHHPYVQYPLVQGHEVSGVIASVGAGVKGFAPGDTVVFMPQVTCGECYPCRHGMYNICDNLKVIGFQAPGAAQEYFPVAAEKVLKLPKSISIDLAALVEPVTVGVHSVSRVGDVAGKKVVVLGAGTIGNIVAQTARALGAADVMITDVSPYKLAKAVESGIPHAVNTAQVDLNQAMIDCFGPDKADLMIECVGASETINQAVDTARKGSDIVVVGVFGKKVSIDIGGIQDRQLNLVGSMMYIKSDWEKAIELVASGKLALQPLITHRFPFRDYLGAYHAIESLKGESMKVLVEL